MEPVEIDGHLFHLLRDRDQGNFYRLSFSGKVTYLEKRVEGILIEPCRREFTRAIPERTATGMILVTATCAGISAAGTFLLGRDSRGQDRQAFKNFVSAYMDAVLQQQMPGQQTPWVDWLYDDVRCGLAHNFTILTGGMKLLDIGGYVRMANHGPEIHAPTFLEDFATGWANHLAGREIEWRQRRPWHQVRKPLRPDLPRLTSRREQPCQETATKPISGGHRAEILACN